MLSWDCPFNVGVNAVFLDTESESELEPLKLFQLHTLVEHRQTFKNEHRFFCSCVIVPAQCETSAQ